MIDLVAYFRRLEEIVGDTTPDDQITFKVHWNTYDEAKQVMGDIRRMQKEIRLLKKHLVLEQSGVRFQFSDAKAQVGNSWGSVAFGAFFGRKALGSANASQRNHIQAQQHKAMSSYDEMKHFMDRMIVKLDNLKGQIEASKEYQIGRLKISTPPPLPPYQNTAPCKLWAFLENSVKGPFTVEQLSGLVKAQVANDTTLVCYDGTEDWIGLFEVPQLGGLL